MRGSGYLMMGGDETRVRGCENRAPRQRNVIDQTICNLARVVRKNSIRTLILMETLVLMFCLSLPSEARKPFSIRAVSVPS